MKTIEIKVYEFDELSKEAKEKAINDYREENEVDLSYKIDEFAKRLMELGYENVEIKYSGFYSQGDGLSFTGKKNGIEIVRKKYSPYNRYVHEETMDCVDYELLIESKELAIEFYYYLRKEYMEEISDERIVEKIKMDDLEFLESGEELEYE